MNNIKRAFILSLLFFLAGCTTTQTNLQEKKQEESTNKIEREYKITSTQEFTLADIKFKIPDYFEKMDDDTETETGFEGDDEFQYTHFSTDDAVFGFGGIKDKLTNENMNDFMDGYFDSDSFESYRENASNIRSRKVNKINYKYVYSSGTYVSDDGSKSDGGLNFYFISNNNKTKFAVIVYTYFDNSTYDYNKVIKSIIKNAEITDEKTNEQSKTTESSATNSTSESSSITSPSVSTTTPTVTTGQKNALSSAKSYLSFMAFSYSGLIKQLEFEGYSQEEATYAADNCGANWNEQATTCAKSYLNTMAFSRQGLIDQLIYEGFSQEQAEYGVTQAGY